jgi:hypothetical protein
MPEVAGRAESGRTAAPDHASPFDQRAGVGKLDPSLHLPVDHQDRLRGERRCGFELAHG